MSSQGGGFLHRFNETLTSEKYVQILENYLVPYAWARFGPTEDDPVPFVQDWSPIHRSYLFRDWFEDEGKEFDVLPWPPKGADINPIENVWWEMVRSMLIYEDGCAALPRQRRIMEYGSKDLESP